jgi:hypothetical protein
MVMQGVSKRALQLYSECCCVTSVTKRSTLEDVQTIRHFLFVHAFSLYAFKWKRFRNTRHTVTFGIPLQSSCLKHPVYYYSLASCCTVLFNGYCRLCFHLHAALLYVGFRCFSLHISAYMAIFKCVGFFIYLFSYA